MKIVFQHDSILPVRTYGGTERILLWHMKELLRQNHQVTYIGNPLSQLTELGIEHIPYDKCSRINWRSLIPKDADILHLQHNSLEEFSIPHVCTVHGNGQLGEEFFVNSVFVSENHAQNHGANAYVHNCFDLSEYQGDVLLRKYSAKSFAFLAKASWKVKNLKQCIQICRQNKKTLHIMGGRYFFPSRYIKGHGLVNDLQKREILGQCDALLFPVRWHEPFGMAVIEAMLVGRPVFASPFGAMPEIIHSEVGVICKNFDDLNQTVQSSQHHFNSATIKKYAQAQFPISKYTKHYLQIYERIIAKEQLHEKSPVWRFSSPPQQLLAF